ncbi:MAG: Putative transmembrane protein, partial [uncultured Gemmatimonadaceae bacterium]
ARGSARPAGGGRRRARRRRARRAARRRHGAPRRRDGRRRDGRGDGAAARGRVGRPGARAPLRHVGGDDGGDDAAVGGATRAAVRDRGAAAAGAAEPGRAHERARGGLPPDVDGVLGRRGARAVGAAPGRAAVAGDGEHEPHLRRAPPRGGRRVPVDAAQGALSGRVPLAARLPVARVARGGGRRARDGGAARPVLRGLLLGADGAAVRGRRDEPALGRRARRLRAGGEGRPRGRVAGPGRGAPARGLGRVDAGRGPL